MGKRKFFEAKVLACLKLSSGVFAIEFMAVQPLNALPGQFVSLESLCPDKMWGRPLAVFQQEKNKFFVVFEVKGRNTKKYSELEVGEKIKIIGPLGKPLEIDSNNWNYIIVAGGIGISGLMLAIKNRGEKFVNSARVYFGAKDQAFIDNFYFPKNQNLTVQTITDEIGFVTDLLERDLMVHFVQMNRVKIIACGPVGMLRKTAEIAATWKIPCQVMMETKMACGVGSCKGCAIPKVGGGYFHLCQDGPALPADEIDWDKFNRPSVIVSPERCKPVEEINMQTVLVGQHGKKLILPSPIIVESGCLDEGAVIDGPVDLTHAGAIKSKGITFEPQAGNPGPRVCEITSGMLNSIGMENVGFKMFIKEQLSRLKSLGITVIPNLSGKSVQEFVIMAAGLAEVGVKAMELNLSCPNTEKGGKVFAVSAGATGEVVKAVHEAAPGVYLFVKLSPMVRDIVEIASAAHINGADALSLCNTFLGMKIDLATRRPAIGNIYGGMSGPGVMPMNLRLVHLVCQQVKMPVVASTGVISGADAAEYIIAGAVAVAVGSGLFSNPYLVSETYYGLREWVVRYGFSDIKELISSMIL